MIGQGWLLSALSVGLMLSFPAQEPSAEVQVQRLAELIRNGTVESVEIYDISKDRQFRVNVNSEGVESWWDSKIVISSFLDGDPQESRGKIAKLLTTVKITERRMPLDLRCGIVFYGSGHKRVAGLYFGYRYLGNWWDGTINGAVGNIPVTYEGKFLRKLRAALFPTDRFVEFP